MAYLTYVDSQDELVEYDFDGYDYLKDIDEIVGTVADNYDDISKDKRFSIDLSAGDVVKATGTFLDGFRVGDEVYYSEIDIVYEIPFIKRLVEPALLPIQEFSFQGIIRKNKRVRSCCR